MQLSVIIVSYNVKYFLEQCLISVINASKKLSVEIWVVDNNSQDGSRQYLECRFSSVSFIWHTGNIGFSAANNLGLKQATGDKILFLNPDTILPEDCLANCIGFFEQLPGIGAAGIRMLDGSGVFLKESKRGFPSPLTSFFKMAGFTAAFPSSKLFARYYLGYLPDNTSNEVTVLSGAFMMVSKEVLDITGGFDEAFFMYGEDIDLSYRIQKAGFKNFYFAGSTIIHFKGESTNKNSLSYVNAFYGAMQLFVKKHGKNSSAIFYYTILRLTIFAKKLTLKSKPKTAKSNNLKSNLKTLIIAGSTDYYNLEKALKTSQPSINILGRIAASRNEDVLATISELPAFAAQNQVEQIIFSNGEISIAEIINKVQQLPKNIQFGYHIAGTKSIISSNDKNHSGFWIELDEIL